MRFLATIPAEERSLYWRNYSQHTGIPEFIVEKDFWVCWLLGRIFAAPNLGPTCVFKGGTSLSKVFHVINRFSEDIDLGLTPASLGWAETDLDEAPSTSQRQKRAKQLQADCAKAVETCFLPELETAATACLGAPADAGHWFRYERDSISQSPVILFQYPRAVAPGSYIAPLVKMEFGSLTDQAHGHAQDRAPRRGSGAGRLRRLPRRGHRAGDRTYVLGESHHPARRIPSPGLAPHARPLRAPPRRRCRTLAPPRWPRRRRPH